MEVAGLAFSIIGLASSCKDCIEILSHISAARSFGRDYELMNAKIDLQRALLMQWVHGVGIGTRKHDGTRNHDPRLDDENIGPAVYRALNGIRDLFHDASTLQHKYGLKQVKTPPSLRTELISNEGMRDLSDRFKELGVNTPDNLKDVSMWKKARWAVHDKAKFEALICDLSHCIEQITRLVPAFKSYNSRALSRDFIPLKTLKESRLVLDAASSTEMVQPSAAARHQQNSEERILNTLYNRFMNQRRDEVDSPFPDTFEWALDSDHESREWSDLPAWLQTCHGIYWIAGKPAAGKSTLMKHILNHQHTKSFLKTWAGDCELTTASFFFRNLGSEHQKSYAGLSRALLFSILDNNRDLIPTLMPNLWREAYDLGQDNLEYPSPTEMRLALDTFASISSTRKFCFFIDGLDEYEGDFFEGISFVQRLTSSENVKVLLSSRPIPPCFEAFHEQPMLWLQDLNRQDIKVYVEGSLGANRHMQDLLESHPQQAKQILSDLVDKAEGVFLWVVLACRSLLAGLAEGDYIHELQARIDDLPPELEDLFAHILARIDKSHQHQAVQLLQIAYYNQRLHERDDRLMALALALMVEQELDLSRMPPFERIADSEKRSRCAKLQMRLRSRCRGLLEVVKHKSVLVNTIKRSMWKPSSHRYSIPERPVDPTVRFLHRTLFEFLDTSDQWIPETMTSRKSLFDPLAAAGCHSVNMAWLSLDWGSRSEFSSASHIWLSSAIQASLTAPVTSIDSILALLFRIGEMARTICRFGDLDAFCTALSNCCNQASTAIALAVEIGMVEFVTVLWKTDQSHFRSTRLPLLYHAIRRPALQKIVGQTPKMQAEMIQFLLSIGCDPNERVDDGSQGDTTRTTWGCWLLDNWRTYQLAKERLSSIEGLQILQVTKDFLAAGADLTTASETLGEGLSAQIKRVLPRLSDRPDFSGNASDQTRLANELLQQVSTVGSRGKKRSRNNLDSHSCPGRKQGNQSHAEVVEDLDGSTSVSKVSTRSKRRRTGNRGRMSKRYRLVTDRE